MEKLSTIFFSNKYFKKIEEMIADNAAISLLNDNESNSMKGLLIMLIVLAHNRYAMESNIAFIYL